MARRRTRSIGDFFSQQIGKLLGWLGLSLVIAYAVAWVIGTLIELLATGEIVSPLWFLEW